MNFDAFDGLYMVKNIDLDTNIMLISLLVQKL